MVIMRTRVKFCGITRILDAQLAAGLGVDAIGLVFYAPSPRAVSIERAREIVSALPAFVTSTALFVNPTPDEVDAVLATVPIDLLQFHGDESGEFCRQFNRPYIKAIAMKPDLNWTALNREYNDARGFLVDTYKPGTPGGTGETFNWNWLPSKQQVDKPIILAGGLDANNVGKAIAQTRVFGVDVSGGIEASKGVKSAEKMQQFIRNLIV